MAEGKDVLSRSKEWGKKYSQVRVLKERMEAALREHMGPEAVADAMRRPAWVGDLHAERERSACRVHWARRSVYTSCRRFSLAAEFIYKLNVIA